MRVQNADPLWQIAEQVAYCFADHGYAYVEDDKIEGLTEVLRSFLTVAGIPVNVAGPAGSAEDPASRL